LWNSYPPGHHEQKFAGTCLFFRTQLHEDEVYEKRECAEFVEAIPGVEPMAMYDYKISQDRLGDAHDQATRAKRLAYIGIVLSVLGLAWNIGKAFLGGG
jgi:hypothetical protein